MSVPTPFSLPFSSGCKSNPIPPTGSSANAVKVCLPESSRSFLTPDVARLGTTRARMRSKKKVAIILILIDPPVSLGRRTKASALAFYCQKIDVDAAQVRQTCSDGYDL